MTGPSARGSLKGTPTSTTSARGATRRSASSDASGVGWPAVRYGISAVRPRARSSRHAGASERSDKVVADRESVAIRGGDLHDGAGELPRRVALGQVDELPRRGDDVAVRVERDADEGPVEHPRVGVGAGHDADLEGVEHDAGAHRVDAEEVDE